MSACLAARETATAPGRRPAPKLDRRRHVGLTPGERPQRGPHLILMELLQTSGRHRRRTSYRRRRAAATPRPCSVMTSADSPRPTGSVRVLRAWAHDDKAGDRRFQTQGMVEDDTDSGRRHPEAIAVSCSLEPGPRDQRRGPPLHSGPSPHRTGRGRRPHFCRFAWRRARKTPAATAAPCAFRLAGPAA